MENAVEALKIAFAVMMFVSALTLSISSFSAANTAAKTIVDMTDREAEYTYVKPSENLSRIVGIETVASTIYSSLNENIRIYFMESDGTTPMPLYYDTSIGTRDYIIKNEDGTDKVIDYIDLSNDVSAYDKKMHIDIIMGGHDIIDETIEEVLKNESPEMREKYKDMYKTKIRDHYCLNGLYDKFKDAQFEEYLGEYKQHENGVEIPKRVITYVKK